MAKANKPKQPVVDNDKKRTRIPQSSVPLLSLNKALKVAQALYDNFASKPTAPIMLAQAIEISPGSSNWRDLAGASAAYGLTTGAYNSDKIGITDLAKKIIAPTVEDGEIQARVEAMLKPDTLKKFFNKYNNAKLPKDVIIENVLREEFSVPQDKVKNVLELIKENGRLTGIFRETKTGTFILIDNPEPHNSSDEDDKADEPNHDNGSTEEIPTELAEKLDIIKPNNPIHQPPVNPNEKPKVFISHGKNKKIVDQLKELVKFGQFEPIVSVDNETTAIPVPDKVFNDMKQCSAGVIHIESEEELLDKEGNKHFKLNENVLIEIGAAIALYGKRFILLCEKSVKLPSNLQGLYRCNYEGQQLDYDATMKLLKTFNEIRN